MTYFKDVMMREVETIIDALKGAFHFNVRQDVMFAEGTEASHELQQLLEVMYRETRARVMLLTSIEKLHDKCIRLREELSKTIANAVETDTAVTALIEAMRSQKDYTQKDYTRHRLMEVVVDKLEHVRKSLKNLLQSKDVTETTPHTIHHLIIRRFIHGYVIDVLHKRVGRCITRLTCLSTDEGLAEKASASIEGYTYVINSQQSQAEQQTLQSLTMRVREDFQYFSAGNKSLVDQPNAALRSKRQRESPAGRSGTSSMTEVVRVGSISISIEEAMPQDYESAGGLEPTQCALLTFNNPAGEALVGRKILYRWPKSRTTKAGWYCGDIVKRCVDPNIQVGGAQVNFYVDFPADSSAADCVLSTRNYCDFSHAPEHSWFLLEKKQQGHRRQRTA